MDEKQIVAALAALAQEHRLRIFRLLVAYGPSGMPAGEIADKVGIGPTNMSFHLKELDRAGLVRATRQGRFIRYAIHVDGMRELLTYLTEHCCQGRPELCGDAFHRACDPCGPAKEEGGSGQSETASSSAFGKRAHDTV
jgi:DNA-binding transcriptional ArsR family regulator